MKAKVLFAVLMGAFFLTACNTMEGLGKDTQAAGRKVETTAEKSK